MICAQITPPGRSDNVLAYCKIVKRRVVRIPVELFRYLRSLCTVHCFTHVVFKSDPTQSSQAMIYLVNLQTTRSQYHLVYQPSDSGKRCLYMGGLTIVRSCQTWSKLLLANWTAGIICLLKYCRVQISLKKTNKQKITKLISYITKPNFIFPWCFVCCSLIQWRLTSLRWRQLWLLIFLFNLKGTSSEKTMFLLYYYQYLPPITLKILLDDCSCP